MDANKIKIPINELDFTFSRSTGKGGQNVNKVNTKVTLRWNIQDTKSCSKEAVERFSGKYPKRVLKDGTVIITSQRFRNQARNIADCIQKLHDMLEKIKTPPKKRKPTKPTRASVEKRLKNKKVLGEKKKTRKKPIRD
ncbi:MAG: aminoacyl-tRNA hydrolase [Bacteriovoracaceae bacterium]|nr:aminoacyl-tRNA hydrolase [Bacteriovoracaceae bacterium]